MRLFGKEVPRLLPEVMGRIGAIVEQPKFMPGFTGRRNLSLLATTLGQDGPKVDEVIETVGLKGRDKDRYRGYSLGMKQRLAIAATLLKKPDLLVLDEPTNGLDPSGIREIRDMVRALASGGTTVLISSHLLAEVEQVCDSVSIIGRGRLLAGGSVADVLRGTGPASVRVRVADPDASQAVLVERGLVVRRDGDLLLVEGAADAADITRMLAERGHYVRELAAVSHDLESVFLEVTEGEGLR